MTPSAFNYKKMLCAAALIILQTITAAYTETIIAPQNRSLQPGEYSLTVDYNSHQLFLTPSLPPTGTGLIPFVPHPFSIRIRQNLLTQKPPNILSGLEYKTEVYLNGNNAPTVSAELDSIFRLSAFSPLTTAIRFGAGGISSMETNAWRTRLGSRINWRRFTFTITGEIGILLDLPTNRIFSGCAAALTAEIVPEHFSATAEIRGSSLERYETGGNISFFIQQLEIAAGMYYRVTQSSTRTNLVFSIGYNF